MNSVQVIENFFGVYLLYCTNIKYKGRNYIGYTVNPRRRLKQHNAGKQFGGAWKTSNRGPWNMILIVHGFPNSTSALRFEWAWQHPETSRRLKHIPKKKSREKVLNYNLMVLSAMLNVGPWCRLPLTIRWLDDEFGYNYSSLVSPPLHMPIIYGKVISKKINNPKKDKESFLKSDNVADILFCYICKSIVQTEESITCIKPNCFFIAHLICLAKMFCKDDMILPIEGCCPSCDMNILWGDLIRKRIGCDLDLQVADDQTSDDTSDDSQYSSND